MTLREIREDNKLTCAVIAHRANMGISYYNEIERCVKMPNLLVMERLAKAYNLDIIVIVNALLEQLHITRSLKENEKHE